MNVAGIDPGVTGALAIVNERGVVFVDDLPVYRVTSGKVIKSQLDVASFREMFLIHEIDHVMIEQVGARPGQGVTSMFRFGHAAGAVYGVIVGLMFPTSFVTPQRWQRHAGIGPRPGSGRRSSIPRQRLA